MIKILRALQNAGFEIIPLSKVILKLEIIVTSLETIEVLRTEIVVTKSV